MERLRTVVKRTYTLYPGCMLEWDNTARRKYNPDIYVDFTPELFRIWLIRNQFYARLYNPEPVTFINAWNEWAEGTYLEPDESGNGKRSCVFEIKGTIFYVFVKKLSEIGYNGHNKGNRRREEKGICLRSWI